MADLCSVCDNHGQVIYTDDNEDKLHAVFLRNFLT